jgi:feruloyl esterase
MPLMVAFGDNFIRYGIVGDTAFNPLSLDPADVRRYIPRINHIARFDSSDADLTPFAARGGKVIIVHGLADMIVSPRVSERYYERLRRRMGGAKVDAFLRFFEVPGYSHGLSNTFNASWDRLTALETWVEQGKAPGEDEVVTDMSGVPGRTRPLCRYPHWPKYRGAGDMNAAASYVCTGG